MLSSACPSPVKTLELQAAIASRQEGVQGEDTNLWSDQAQLILKLQQAEKLLTAQSDLIDGLRAQLGDTQQRGLPAQELHHQQLESMPDASLAAMQQQNIAQSLASDVQRMAQTVQPLRSLPENSLAAVQQHQMVYIIRETTRYLNKDLNVMMQTCKALTARQGQHAMAVTQLPCSQQQSRISS
ncbi:hypothetical protein WJX77_007554 [Trebouxia sp. C0004]